MRQLNTIALALFPVALAAASCGAAQSGDSAGASVGPFKVTAQGSFDNGWAMAFAPGTQVLFVTEKPGTMKFVDLPSGRIGTVTGVPQVAYAGQGGLADVAFLASEASPTLTRRTIYLSWAEPGEGGLRGGAVGRGTLVCDQPAACHIDGLQVIWRQTPKTAGPLQYALRLTFSPDGRYLFVASGDRVAIDNVQTLASNLGKIVRLLPDGSPAPAIPSPRRAARRTRCGRWVTATRSGSSSTSPGSCSTSSTARRAATRSTGSSRARTTAGRWSRPATTTTARRSRRTTPAPTSRRRRSPGTR
jgi:glucose/arabinose dehydrogenase